MTILQKQTSLFTEEQLTFFQEDSHVNHIASLEQEKVKRMIDTSGLKCLEQYEKFSRATLWGKTFMALLIGTGDWYSTRCKLTWKVKATKYNQLYFQLVAKTHPTEEKGSGFWPTATTSDTNAGKSRLRGDYKRYRGEDLATFAKRTSMYPTPRSRESGDYTYDQGDHSKPRLTLTGVAKMWPTPRGTKTEGYSSEKFRPTLAQTVTGQKKPLGGQLNPMWVEWLMGFPLGWTDLEHSETP